MPVKGKIPIIAPILTKVWTIIQQVIPRADNWQNLSLDFLAILKPLHKNIKKRKIKLIPPIKPASLEKTAKIESEIVCGRKPNS